MKPGKLQFQSSFCNTSSAHTEPNNQISIGLEAQSEAKKAHVNIGSDSNFNRIVRGGLSLL